MKISKQVGRKGIGVENSFHWYSQLLSSSLIHPTYRHGHVIRMNVVSVVVSLDRVFLVVIVMRGDTAAQTRQVAVA
jgi:hypothetical protein